MCDCSPGGRGCTENQIMGETPLSEQTVKDQLNRFEKELMETLFNEDIGRFTNNKMTKMDENGNKSMTSWQVRELTIPYILPNGAKYSILLEATIKGDSCSWCSKKKECD
jgi:hypothetical protein